MTKQIEFTINKKGAVTIEAKGFSGGDCRTATEAYEKALAGDVKKRKMKSVKELKQEVKVK